MRKLVATTMIGVMLGGCAAGPDYYSTPVECPPAEVMQVAPLAPVHANPVFLPIADPQCAWETVVDVVDDYFRIEHEEPVRLVGNTLLEGHLTTLPEISPTIFEPWRRDTVDREQRIENTLQTMRRRAALRVIPAQGGYWVNVQVFKDLEDNRRPDRATAGGTTFRYDSTLTGVVNPITDEPTTLGWIARGRDAPMEQHLIAHLMSRCGQTGAVALLGKQGVSSGAPAVAASP